MVQGFYALGHSCFKEHLLPDLFSKTVMAGQAEKTVFFLDT
jgi:hypothetical protein